MTPTELKLARVFMESYPEEAALSMERMPHEDASALLYEIPVETAASVVVRMAPQFVVERLVSLPAEFAGELLGTMPRDQSALILRRMRPEDRERLLNATPAPAASSLTLLLRFPENTAGSLMDPEVLSLPRDMPVSEALEYVRRPRIRIAYYLYVIDRGRKLAGVLNLRELIEAPDSQLLEDVMHPHVIRLSVHADPIAMRAHPGWLDYYALPVVDDHGVLVGLLRYKTLRAAYPEDGGIAGKSDPLAASLALGELYWSTLGQLLQTMWPELKLNTKAKPEEPDGR